MKLKQWLKEQKDMPYQEYKKLPDIEQYILQGEHRDFCRREEIHKRQNWRPMTEEEKRQMDIWSKKEIERYQTSLKNGGIDARGNYTALHYR